MAKRRGLARGLDALLTSANGTVVPGMEQGELRAVPVDLIERGRYQPRTHIDPEALEDLARSIRAQGVVQPIVLRTLPGTGEGERRYEIIAGERRWRAAQLAGLEAVPAVVREASDDDVLAVALIENIQREDLNPVEEAQALARLVEEFGLTHQAVAEAIGRSRASVTNLLRLLELEPEVRGMLERGELEMGTGRALLGLAPDLQRQAAAEIVARGLTVRQAEALVRRLREGPKDSAPTTSAPSASDPDVERLQRELSERLGAPVQIRHDGRGRGRLTIRFESLDEFEGILERFR